MEYKIGFVILHYNSYKETIQCALSIIQKMDTKRYEIVIVDNCSPNKSLPLVKESLRGLEKISYIQLEKNEGFARGNNRGIDYARKQLNCDFVCCLNNDTEIIQDDFCQTVYKEYEASHFAILGPKIVLNDGCNPTNEDYQVTLQSLNRELKELKMAYFMTRIYIGELLKKVRKKKERLTAYGQRHEDVVLHGCCLVFSPAFFEKISGFYPGTFMFREEEFLYTLVKQNQLKMVYNPELLIRHYEDSATNSVYKTSRTKSLFHLKNSIDSTKLLINYAKEHHVLQ